MMIINLIGLALIALIALIVWWFWLHKPEKAVDSSVESIMIVVNDGVYQPSRIKVAAGKKTRLQLFRKDASPCAASVLFPNVEVSEELALEVNKSVDLPPMSPREYPFHCPMKMYIGTLIVEE